MAARKLEDAQEFAKKHSIPRAYGGYEALARDPDIGEFLSHRLGSRCLGFFSFSTLESKLKHTVNTNPQPSVESSVISSSV